MAIKNPKPSDFMNHQQRALDYQQYRTTTDILRAVSEFYKVALYKTADTAPLNFVARGLTVEATYDSGVIDITVDEGACVFDNQPIVFDTDFTFEYDAPSADTTYYIYIFYKYVEEYPPNYAFIEVYTSENTDDGYHLLATVDYDAANNSLSLNDSYLKTLQDKMMIDIAGVGNTFYIKDYVSVNSDYTANPNEMLLVDTSTAPVTVTLPADPENYDNVYVFDMKNTFDKNNLTVKLGNANHTFDGLNIDIVLNDPGARVTFFYANGNWKVNRSETRDTGVYATRVNSNPGDVIVIPEGHNGFAVDQFVIEDNATLEIPENSVFKIL